jgi:hypothetical protein
MPVPNATQPTASMASAAAAAGSISDALDDLRLKVDADFDTASSFDVPAFLRRQEG